MALTYCPVCERKTPHFLPPFDDPDHCTEHSKWPSPIKRMLARDLYFERKSSGDVDLPAYVPPMVKGIISQRPLLTKRITKTPETVDKILCVGCKGPVSPGFCHTGTVIAGLIAINVESTTPVLGVMMVIDEIILLGGELTTKRISVMKRNRGFICEKCASNYSTVERIKKDGSIESHPVVKTDPLPGVIRTTLQGVEDRRSPSRPRAAFNTRYTQGRRGKRV